MIFKLLLAFTMHSVCIAQSVVFQGAMPSSREFLINLAVESNDIYHTRVASIDTAREVLNIPDEVFVTGVIEVLKVDDEIVGFYTLKNHPSGEGFEHELGHLFVKAGLQRRGYGTLLFHRALSVAKEKGWHKMEWISDPDAEQFYLKMGAVVVDHCENLLNPSVDLPIFSFVLDKN